MQKLFLFLCVCVCVCMVSQFDLSITKQNYIFVRCQSLPHIPNTSLRYSNQPLWKLNLMTGVSTTKQTGEIKNNKQSNLVELNKVWKQPQRCPGKKYSYKQLFWKLPREIFSQNPWKISSKSSFFVKLHYLVSGRFYRRKKQPKNTIFTKFFIR